MQVIVEWAANWCSLSVEADLEFTRLAAGLDRERQRKMKFIRVNLDRAEVLFQSGASYAVHFGMKHREG